MTEEMVKIQKQRKQAKERKQGHEAGRRRAMENAVYRELMRFCEFDFSFTSRDTDLSRDLGKAAIDRDDPDRSVVEEFRSDVVGEQSPSMTVIEAFYDGALKIWNKVANRMQGGHRKRRR
jgi:hypothetical protein